MGLPSTRPMPRRSPIAHSAVTMASTMVSYTGSPSSLTMSVLRWGPTLRTSIRARPGIRTGSPSGPVKLRSPFNDRFTAVPPRTNVVCRVPRMSPSQFR